MTSQSRKISGSPGLAAITLKQGGDGVAYAAVLLERALAELTQASVPVLELSPTNPAKPSLREKARFVLRIGAAQVLVPDSWWLFNHVGIARAQNLIPSFARRRFGVLLCGVESWDPALSLDRKRVLRRACARIAISRYTASRVSEQHPDIGEVVACPLALLPASPIATTFDRGVLSQIREKSVLIVGRMSRTERYKGHDELLECWSSVTESLPGAQLVIVGKGDDVTRLREKTAALGLSDDVLFLGFVADGTLEAIRQRVAFFALPSRGEGFGLVYLDAMRAGLACIGGSGDAAGSVIEDGVTGVLVDPEEREALAAAIVDLLRFPEKRAAYGAAGQQRFETEFTFERYCDRLRTILVDAFA